jgi:hypothetical protein
MKCPNCELENPPEALRCDCGYNFPSGTVKSPYLTPKDVRQMAQLRQSRVAPRWLRYLVTALLICTSVSRLLESLVKSPRSLTVVFLFCALIVAACWFISSLISKWR